MTTYDEAGNRGTSTRADAICMIVLPTVAVALRFWARLASAHAGLWWDDWLCLVGWVFAMIEISFAFPLTANGLGRHIGTIPPSHVDNVLKYVYIQEFFYNFALTFIKLSCLMFYVRIFTMRKKWFKWTVWGTGSMVVAWGIYTTFLGAFQCTPARKAWDPKVEGHCISETAAYIATAAPNVVMDFMLLLMPLPFLVTLQTSMKRKIGVILIFVVGYLVPVVSIVRTVQASLLTPAKYEDFTWNNNLTAILFYIETGLGLISICLPAHVYLFRTLLKQFHASHPRFRFSRSMSFKGKYGMHMGGLADPRDRSRTDTGFSDGRFEPRTNYSAQVWSETCSHPGGHPEIGAGAGERQGHAHAHGHGHGCN